MDTEKPKPENDEKVIPSGEFFWRKFRYYLQQMVYGKITNKQFVENMLKLGYTPEQIKKILEDEPRN